MDNETLQWLAIALLAVWVVGLSWWQDEVHSLLHSWWEMFLQDVAKDEYKKESKGNVRAKHE